ncbi:hypothetical protein SLEP1_g26977 [Rubroshorea leprosula]|uniref:Cytochrome P450 n=1 Tax=Rubroshorea leprosula TaxID=152421 RepID=A0AAV5JY72_9ROSI|nr:hypothetical protein SLEP1_g26977 [Rubroshorea leprosula]
MDLLSFISSPISLAAITLALILAMFMIKIHGRSSSEKEEKKGYHPVAGTILHQLVNLNRLHDYMTDLSRKNRTYRLLGLGLFSSRVYTVDPANVEYMLKTNFANYGKGKYQHGLLSDLLGDGIFTVDGEKWRHQRKASSYEFSTRTLREFSSVVFKKNAAKLTKVVSEAAASNKCIDVQDLFMKSTLDSVFKIMLGVELDSLCGTYEEGKWFSNAFDKASEITLHRYFDPFWKIKSMLNIGSEAVLKDCIKVVDEFVNKIIQGKIEHVQYPQPQEDLLMKRGDILSRFLESDQNDVKYLKDIILCFIIAGKDTTAGTLSWFLYMLCKNTTIQEKIAKEVREAAQINDDLSINEVVSKINEESLDKMQYLQAALTETLRLYPAVPVEGKICFADDTMPDGFRVREGDLVGYQPYAMGRMEFLWGHDAEEFRPERWIDENGLFQQESPFKFTAFQAGPRICLGKEFAYRQMKIFSAVLFGCFRFKLSDEKKAVNYRVMLTLNIDGGIHLQAFPRLKCT